MPKRKSGGKSATRPASKKKVPAASEKAVGTTASGPSHPTTSRSELAAHAAEQQTLVEATPFNAAKKSEYGAPSTAAPPKGPHRSLPSPTTGAGTLSEKYGSLKTGPATLEPHALDGSLANQRVNSEGQVLTTNQGVPVGLVESWARGPDAARRLYPP
jgi:catalase